MEYRFIVESSTLYLLNTEQVCVWIYTQGALSSVKELLRHREKICVCVYIYIHTYISASGSWQRAPKADVNSYLIKAFGASFVVVRWLRMAPGWGLVTRKRKPWLEALHFLKKVIFNWRIVALQYCVGFCHLSTWISHRYTYVSSLLNLPPTSEPLPPL